MASRVARAVMSNSAAYRAMLVSANLPCCRKRGSLVLGGRTRGCLSSSSYSEVVPHFISPRMKNFGRQCVLPPSFQHGLRRGSLKPHMREFPNNLRSFWTSWKHPCLVFCCDFGSRRERLSGGHRVRWKERHVCVAFASAATIWCGCVLGAWSLYTSQYLPVQVSGHISLTPKGVAHASLPANAQSFIQKSCMHSMSGFDGGPPDVGAGASFSLIVSFSFAISFSASPSSPRSLSASAFADSAEVSALMRNFSESATINSCCIILNVSP
mmetsp:Transcript_6911/g.16053  ORF Transcript_6911/g.16053 Transcript_6911/m.16053 type:complete len:269 (-) Transcript_6911:459-1265(-)